MRSFIEDKLVCDSSNSSDNTGQQMSLSTKPNDSFIELAPPVKVTILPRNTKY